MTNYAAQLKKELESLRRDQRFMSKHMKKSTISDFTGMGFYAKTGWKKYTRPGRHFWEKVPFVILSEAEVFRAVDMRKLLLGMFWNLQGHNPKDKNLPKTIDNDAFWLVFLKLAKAAKWRRKSFHQAILNSDSPLIPRLIKVSSWFYFLTYSHIHDHNKMSLPPEAFEHLEHVDFSPEQKKRWETLPAFGLEALFQEQIFRTNLTIGMSSATLTDWFTFALARRRPDLVCHWLEKHPAAQLGMSTDDILLYVVANYHGDAAIKVIKCLEKISPGICVTFQDRHGNNLLWYAAACWQLRRQFAAENKHQVPLAVSGNTEHTWERLTKRFGNPDGRNTSNGKKLKYLFALGLSPDQPNHYGFTFRDLDDLGRLFRDRWQISRLQERTPTFDDNNYWRQTVQQ